MSATLPLVARSVALCRAVAHLEHQRYHGCSGTQRSAQWALVRAEREALQALLAEDSAADTGLWEEPITMEAA